MPQKMPYARDVILNNASGVIELDEVCYQFVLLNITSKVIKLDVGILTTNSYRFIINAKEYFVSPVFPITNLKYLIDAYADTPINPTLWIYRRAIFTPMVSKLT